MTSDRSSRTLGDRDMQELLSTLAPQVLGTLTRRTGDFDAAEDALQEALLAASTHWPVDGVPANPGGWLYTAARNSLIDTIRSNAARRQRERTMHLLDEPLQAGLEDVAAAAGADDDMLTLLFLCCHPALTEPAQIVLTLRCVAGLTTAQIAAGHLMPEPTIGQRISRAKQRLTEAGASFSMPTEQEAPDRLAAVLRVLYLLFNEGHTASSGDSLTRPDLTAEAIRLTRVLHRLQPVDGEVTGLLALMLLTEARRPARVGQDGSLIPIDQQDRSRWTAPLIAEGVALITAALGSGPPGPYQVQAAIAAVHDEATSTDTTDWTEVLGLYAVLEDLEPNPVITLNRAIALSRVHGPQAALQLLDTVADDPRLTRHHRLPAVRAHLLEMAGDRPAAREAYLTAARKALSLPERRYLQRQAAAAASSEQLSG